MSYFIRSLVRGIFMPRSKFGKIVMLIIILFFCIFFGVNVFADNGPGIPDDPTTFAFYQQTGVLANQYEYYLVTREGTTSTYQLYGFNDVSTLSISSDSCVLSGTSATYNRYAFYFPSATVVEFIHFEDNDFTYNLCDNPDTTTNIPLLFDRGYYGEYYVDVMPAKRSNQLFWLELLALGLAFWFDYTLARRLFFRGER